MKRIFWILLFASTVFLVLASCGPSATATPIPTISLDASEAPTRSQINASGVVVPAQQSGLSFVISGMVEEVNVEEGDQVKAGQALVQLDTSDLQYNVVAAEAALASAELEAQIERQPRKRFNSDTFNFEYVTSPGEKILEADSRADQRWFALEAAKAALDQGILLAPFEGTVIDVNIAQGEFVQPSQVILELADLEHLQVETTDLSELSVTAVRIGQPASVFVEALNKEFLGQVIAISPIADTIGGDVVFRVTIGLDEQPDALLWGMSADVEIDIE